MKKEEGWKKLSILEVPKISFIILAQSDNYIGSAEETERVATTTQIELLEVLNR
jgi:hypothetical protein